MPLALSSSRLRRIIAAYTINRLGTWFGLLALVIVVYDHTHGALGVTAVLLTGQALPAFAVPAIVARVEASNARRELTGLYVFEAVVTAGLAVLVWNFSLPAVLVLIFLDGTAALTASSLLRAEVARAAREHVTGDVIEPPGLPLQPLDGAIAGSGASPPGDDADESARHHVERQANAALNVAFSTTFVLGPALGALVVAAAGASTALFIDVGSFVVCAVMVLDLHPHIEEAGGDSVRARLKAAWQHINEAPSLRALLLAQGIAQIFIETGAPIEVSFMKGTLHGGTRALGVLLTMWGAGAVVGSIAFARLVKRPLAQVLGAGTIAIGTAYLVLAASHSLIAAYAAGLIGGVGNGMQWPSLISIVQRASPERLHGRMMGAVESLGAVCLALGLSLGGVLVALTTTRAAFVIVGAGAIVMTVVLLRLTSLSLGAAQGSGAPLQDPEPPPAAG